jgi:hypothetical protein
MNKHLRQLGRGFVNLGISVGILAAMIGILAVGAWLLTSYPAIVGITLGVIGLFAFAYYLGDDTPHIPHDSSDVPWEDE